MEFCSLRNPHLPILFLTQQKCSITTTLFLNSNANGRVAHLWRRIKGLGTAATATWRVMQKNHTLAIAAGLSYYFLLSLFPAMIFAAAVLGYLPLPHLFDQLLFGLAKVMPADSMAVVRKTLEGVFVPNRAGLLSFGMLFTLWSTSGGFAAIIEGLNVAYDVPETRPIWRTRSLAIGLTFLVGILMVIALGALIVGPQFGNWIARHTGTTVLFAWMWPYLRWLVAVSFTVLAVELLYFLAPNIKQRFWSTLPGAIFSVGAWILVSLGLGIYLREFPNYNKTYGSLGAVIALMLWFYLSGIVLLVGAEFNAQYARCCGDPQLPLKDGQDVIHKQRPSAQQPEAA
jgi:membrane protein